MEAQRSPYFHKLAAEAGTPENIASKNIQAAWGIPQIPNKKSITVPLSTSKSDQRTRSQSKAISEQVYKPGTIIRKDFKEHGWHEGEVKFVVAHIYSVSVYIYVSIICTYHTSSYPTR